MRKNKILSKLEIYIITDGISKDTILLKPEMRHVNYKSYEQDHSDKENYIEN